MKTNCQQLQRALPAVGAILDKSFTTTSFGTPDDTRLYAWDVAGVGSYSRGARALVNGRKAFFAICSRGPNAAPPVVEEIAGFGMGNVEDDETGEITRCARFLGEREDPDSVGSHSLIASWYRGAASDPVNIAAAMATYCERRAARLAGGSVFLLARGEKAGAS